MAMDEHSPRPWVQWALGVAGILLMGTALGILLRGSKAPAPVVRPGLNGRTSLHMQQDGPALNCTGIRVPRSARGASRRGRDSGRWTGEPLGAERPGTTGRSRVVLAGIARGRVPVGTGWSAGRGGSHDGSGGGAASVAICDDETPRKRGAPIKRVEATQGPVYEREVRRGPPVIRKIPLLRRLWGKRDRER